MTPEHSAPADKTGAMQDHDVIGSHKIEPQGVSAVNPENVQQEALRRHRMGWSVVWAYPGSKRPQDDWDTVVYTDDQIPAAFPVADLERNVRQRNIGVRLGRDSGGLVVVDLDHVNPAIAALAFPHTGLRDGRPGNPNSHWFYRIKRDFAKATFKSPMLGDKAALEILGDGQQTILPPSLHDSGEHRSWVVDGEVATVDADDLRAAAGQAAAFNEIALLWSEIENRHESSLPLVGGLLRAGVDEGTIEALLDHIWPSAEKGEIAAAITSTAKGLEEGKPTTGWRKLRTLWGEAAEPSIAKILEWLGAEEAYDERPRVVFGSGMLKTATKQGWDALSERNDPPKLFLRAGQPVRIKLDEKERALVEHLDVYSMRYHLVEEIRWLKPGRNGVLGPADASVDLVRNILAVPNPALPPLTTVTMAPVLSPEGEIQTEPGYHADSQSYYWPMPGVEVPGVSVSPSKDEVKRAKALLLDEMLGDFPFDSNAEKANALALLLLPFGRQVIEGPTPIHFIEAPKAGTGKSKLAHLATMLTCGPSGAASISETTDEEEWRKRITSSLLTGSPFLFIDNITQTLQSSNISTATTKREWKDRILGTNDEVTLDIRVVWIVTANNASMSVDNARRSIRIRLNARVEDPFTRLPETFRHPNLEKWVFEHWGELVWACLTLWRAWVAAGKPAGTAVLGSFEDWAATMSGLMDVIGVPGFLTNTQDFMSMADESSSRWHELMEAWWERFGSEPVRPKELYDEIALRVEGFDYGGRKDHGGRVTAFGIDLKKQRDTIHGDLQVVVEIVRDKPVYRLHHLRGETRHRQEPGARMPTPLVQRG